jgi:HEAT repeat protein
MLESDDSEQVSDAAQQLGEIGDQIAVEPLVMLFNDMKSSMQVKLAVAEALLKLEGAPVEVALLAALRHNDWHIRRNGAAILGQLKAEWAVEPLSKALSDPHTTVRRTARAALQRIGTSEAMEIIRRRSSNLPKSASEAPPSRSTTSSQETIPSAPRDGLLNRLREQNEQQPVNDTADTNTSEVSDVAKHLQPTKPLDPKVVEEIERMRREKLLSDQKKTDEDESS